MRLYAGVAPEVQVRSPSSPETALASMTHARLRVRQGDYREAGRLLREILERNPQHAEARELLLGIARRPDTTAPRVQEERPTSPPTPSDPECLVGRFREVLGGSGFAPSSGDRRVGRLERWLHKIRRGA